MSDRSGRGGCPRGVGSAIALLVTAVMVSPSLAAQEREPDDGVAVDGGVLVQDVRVSSFPGDELNATLTLPAGPHPAPAVLLLLPADGSEAPAADGLGRVLDELARRGIASLRMRLRSDGAAGERSGQTGGANGGDGFAAIQFLLAREDIDGDRIAVVAYGPAAGPALDAAVIGRVVRALVLIEPVPPSVARAAGPADVPLLVRPRSAVSARDALPARDGITGFVAAAIE